MLSSLFEGTKSPERVQMAGRTLDQLFRAYPTALAPHVHAIQDWLRFVGGCVVTFEWAVVSVVGLTRQRTVRCSRVTLAQRARSS